MRYDGTRVPAKKATARDLGNRVRLGGTPLGSVDHWFDYDHEHLSTIGQSVIECFVNQAEEWYEKAQNQPPQGTLASSRP